jgi:hypothetical protein
MDRYFIRDLCILLNYFMWAGYIERTFGGDEENRMYIPPQSVPPQSVPPPPVPPLPSILFWDGSSYPIRTKCYPDTAGGELPDKLCAFLKETIKETIRDKPRFLAPPADRSDRPSLQVESRLGAFLEFLRNVLHKQGWRGVDLDPYKQDIALWVQQYDTARRECLEMFDSV